jgi:hypothetical protein
MSIPRSVEDLEKLIASEVPESLHLDYKESPAITKSKRDEIAKDVSAMANSDGGLIIYGIKEKNHLPVSMDGGLAEGEGPSREWLEQILSSVISPRIGGLEIVPIPAGAKRTYFCISVTRSDLAPHQAPDKKYYKRYNFQSAPMDHYEIVDIGNRRLMDPRAIDLRSEYREEHNDVCLVLTNIGHRVLRNVAFSFPGDLKWPSRLSENMPAALKDGIKYFPPDLELAFDFASPNQIWGDGATVPKEFEVVVSYLPDGRAARVSEVVLISFVEYEGTLIQRSGHDRIARVLERGFRDVQRGLDGPFSRIVRQLQRARPKEPPSYKRWRRKKDW